MLLLGFKSRHPHTGRLEHMAALGIGSVIDGSYKITGFLSEGGMGTLWHGVAIQSNHHVVAKEPKVTGRPEVDRINFEKLQVEAYLLKILSHQNIVRYIDMRSVGMTPVLFTEFIPGESLEKIRSGVPMREEEAVGHALQLLEAVEYMHSMNMIHRDIRPKNLLVRNSDGLLKVIDFGTAKFFNNQANTPEAIIAPGGYSPPEHYHLGYSPQGDIWSVGATLLFLLTARLPSTMLPGYPNVQGPPVFSGLLQDTPDHIRGVLMKALQPQPSMRFLTAGEMKQILGGAKSAVSKNPVLTVRNQEISITTRRVIIGRDDRLDFLFIGAKDLSLKSFESLRSKPYAKVEGDATLLKLADPGSYVSRNHIELFERGGMWYVRDLGSLNGSAVLLAQGWQTISSGHTIQGTPYPLGMSNVISLGYNTAKGPYIVVTFAISQPGKIEVTYSGQRR